MVQVVRGFGALYFSCPVSTQQANTYNGASHKMGQHIVRTPTGTTGIPKKGRRKDPSRSYKADCADSCNEVSLSQSGFHHRLRSARTSSVSHVTHARHESRES
jgi:hypothetical protein